MKKKVEDVGFHPIKDLFGCGKMWIDQWIEKWERRDQTDRFLIGFNDISFRLMIYKAYDNCYINVMLF